MRAPKPAPPLDRSSRNLNQGAVPASTARARATSSQKQANGVVNFKQQTELTRFSGLNPPTTISPPGMTARASSYCVTGSRPLTALPLHTTPPPAQLPANVLTSKRTSQGGVLWEPHHTSIELPSWSPAFFVFYLSVRCICQNKISTNASYHQQASWPCFASVRDLRSQPCSSQERCCVLRCVLACVAWAPHSSEQVDMRSPWAEGSCATRDHRRVGVVGAWVPTFST